MSEFSCHLLSGRLAYESSLYKAKKKFFALYTVIVITFQRICFTQYRSDWRIFFVFYRAPNITGVPNKRVGENFFLKINKTGGDLIYKEEVPNKDM